MLKLVNDNLVIRYQLPPKMIDVTYPVTPDGDVKLTEQTQPLFDQYDIDPNKSFEELKDTAGFQDMAIRNIGATSSLYDGVIEDVSLASQRHFVGKTVIVTDPFVAIKRHDFQAEYGIIRAIIKENHIMAVLENNKLAPVGTYIELEAEIPADVLLHLEENTNIKYIRNSWDESIDRDKGEFYLEEIRYAIFSKFAQPLPQDILRVSAIGTAVKVVKEGEHVMVPPSFAFELKNIKRIDWDNKKIYFIRPESDILAIKQFAK